MKKLTALLCCLAGAAICIVLSGCSSFASYQSGKNYDEAVYCQAAQRAIDYEGVSRNPVIVVHGFLGSNLTDPATKENVWGYFTGIESTEGISDEKMRLLAMPMEPGKKLSELRSAVYPSGMLEQFKVRLMGMPVHLAAYGDMLAILRQAGYCQEGKELIKGKKIYNLFAYSYDWRLDLPTNAAILHKFILGKRAYMQKQYETLYGVKNYDVHFDLIGHSMGGLLSRYYLRFGEKDLPEDGSLPDVEWRGARYVDKVLIVGTPNAGYLDTIFEMTEGLELVSGSKPYPQAVIGTWATYYQMLPATGFKSVVWADDQKTEVDIFDPQVWIDMKWGLANPKYDEILQKMLPQVKTVEQRRKIALDHLNKCLKRAKYFTRAMRIYAKNPPDNVALYLFNGDAVKTRFKATVDRKNGKLTNIYEEPGDGKVLAISAVYDENFLAPDNLFIQSPVPWTSILRLPGSHMGITKSQEFMDNAMFILLCVPTEAQKKKYWKKDYLKKENRP